MPNRIIKGFTENHPCPNCRKKVMEWCFCPRPWHDAHHFHCQNCNQIVFDH